MNYRCLTCGYTQDFAPGVEANAKHHPRLTFKSADDCPACVGYLKKWGGRRNGKIRMPDISAPGTLKAESEITSELEEINEAFVAITERGDGEVAKKYAKRKLFGWTGDELLRLREER